MAEEDYQYNTEDIGRYRAVALIPEFLEEKNLGALENTLIELSKNIGVREKDRKGVASIFSNPQSLEKTLEIFGESYKNSLYSQKIKDLREYYSSSFEDVYTEENLPKVNEIFNSDIKYEEISRRYNNAKKFMELQGNEYKEQREQAKKDYAELSKVVVPLQEFENFELDKIRDPARKEALKKRLNSMYQEETNNSNKQ
jgi:hypothetical protein